MNRNTQEIDEACSYRQERRGLSHHHHQVRCKTGVLFTQLHASEPRVALDRVLLTSCALQIVSSVYPALLVYCEWFDLRRPRFAHCFLECLEFLGFLDFLGCLEVLGVLGFLGCPIIHDQNAATG